jgi:hypothetical protein
MGHEPILDISAKIARGVIRSCMKRKHDGYWQSIRGQSQTKSFLKKPSAKRAEELLNLSRNQFKIMKGLPTAHWSRNQFKITKGLPTAHCHLKVICLNLGL